MSLFSSISSIANGMSLESAGSAAVGALPIPFGSQLGGVAGKLLDGLLGGKKAFDASPAIQAVAAYSGFAEADVSTVIAYHCSVSSDRFDDLSAFVARTPARWSSLVVEYNGRHPGAGVYRAASVVQSAPLPSSVLSVVPAVQVQAVPVASSLVAVSSLTGGASSSSIGDILNGALNGAVDGATKVAAATPQGKHAINTGILSWLNDNAIFVALGAVPAAIGLTLLIKKK